MEVEQPEPANLLSPVTAKELDQAMGGGDIGTHGVRRPAAIMGKMASPSRGHGPCRMLIFV